MNIVVTGAGKGIGKAIAERFSTAGNQVFICARNKNDLLKVAHELTEKNSASAIKFFYADKNEILKFTNWLSGQKAKIDILINNAGQFLPGSVNNEPEGTLEKMISVNLNSAYHLT